MDDLNIYFPFFTFEKVIKGVSVFRCKRWLIPKNWCIKSSNRGYLVILCKRNENELKRISLTPIMETCRDKIRNLVAHTPHEM